MATTNAPPGGPRPVSIRIETFRPVIKNTLRGFVSVLLPKTHLSIRDIALHKFGERYWVSLPAKPLLNPDGSPMIGRNGKAAWFPLLQFADRAAREQFQNEVIAALRRVHPEAFNE